MSAQNPRAFSWLRLWQMVRKEIRQLLRDPKARPIIFIAPVAQFLLLSYAATTDVKDIRTVLVDHDRSAESRALVEAFQSTGYFRVVARTDRDAEVASALERGEAAMGLTIPPGFGADARGGRGARVQVVLDGADASLATVAQSYATQVAARFGASLVGARPSGGVELRSRAWFNPTLESRFFNVPAIMGVLSMLVCLLLTALGVVRERETGTLDQLLVSPITPAELMAGKTIPVLGVGLLHLSIYTATSVLHFGAPFRGSVLSLLAAALLYVTGALGLGLLISSVSRTQQEAFMLLILCFLPAVMLSGFLSPVEGMPAVFRWLTVVNPLRYFLEIVRGVFLRGVGVVELWPQYLALSLMAAAWFALAARRFRRMMA